MISRLGLILLFPGDYRRVNAAIKNVTSFSAISAKLMQGDQDVAGTYINDAPTTVGNMIVSGKIGDKAAISYGNYRYYATGTYSGKIRTWYWDVMVLPQDTSLLAGLDIPPEDYDPLIEEVVINEGDKFAKELVVPGVEFTAASGKLFLLSDDKTATYCTGSATPSGDTITTHNIGNAASIPPGEYAYLVTGTYNEGEAVSTWYWKITVLPKQGVLP